MFVRPVRSSDINDLLEISKISIEGMTTLPRSYEEWGKLVKASIKSFNNLPKLTKPGSYLLVLEDNGKIIGTSAIYTYLGDKRPFYSYMVSKFASYTPNSEIYTDGSILHLVSNYTGASEVGTLILPEKYRSKGGGRLLAIARYFLIAKYMNAFPNPIIAELRGWSDKKNRRHFWNAIGKKFFKGSFEKADKLSIKDDSFISDLMPNIPIYVDLLSKKAKYAIGRPHSQALPAFNMLKKQGFRYRNMIDVFDGGPAVEADKQDIETIKNIKKYSLKKVNKSCNNAIACYSKADKFAVFYGTIDRNKINLPKDVIIKYKLNKGQKIKGVYL